MYHTVNDKVLNTIANKTAEACLRGNFRRALGSPVVTPATPPRATPTSSWHSSIAEAYGLYFRPDPDLQLTDPLCGPPTTTPPSTHLMGPRGSPADEEGSDGWDMGRLRPTWRWWRCDLCLWSWYFDLLASGSCREWQLDRSPPMVRRHH